MTNHDSRHIDYHQTLRALDAKDGPQFRNQCPEMKSPRDAAQRQMCIVAKNEL